MTGSFVLCYDIWCSIGLVVFKILFSNSMSQFGKFDIDCRLHPILQRCCISSNLNPFTFWPKSDECGLGKSYSPSSPHISPPPGICRTFCRNFSRAVPTQLSTLPVLTFRIQFGMSSVVAQKGHYIGYYFKKQNETER